MKKKFGIDDNRLVTYLLIQVFANENWRGSIEFELFIRYRELLYQETGYWHLAPHEKRKLFYPSARK